MSPYTVSFQSLSVIIKPVFKFLSVTFFLSIFKPEALTCYLETLLQVMYSLVGFFFLSFFSAVGVVDMSGQFEIPVQNVSGCGSFFETSWIS